MGLVCARRKRPISGSASDYEGLSGDGSAGGPQEDFAGRRATTWPTMASWRRYDASPTNLRRLMYGLLTDPLLNGTAGGI